MGSATREALAQARAALDGARGVKLATGESLLSAARALASSAQLRGVLGDPAVGAAEKSKLIGKVFAGADAVAARVLAAVAGARWSTQDDLVDGVEELGIRAVALAAAKADLEGELFAVGRAIASAPDLQLALGSKLGDPAAKAKLVEQLLGKKASPATLAILRHLVQSPRGRRIGELVRRSAAIVADTGGRLIATVTAAAPLSAAQQRRLGAAIKNRYGREARIDLVIDPSVVGGLRVRVGDEVFDGTVSARLADLRLQLAG